MYTADRPLSAPGPGRIAVAGDWHGNTHRACESVWYARLREADIVLQLGDFGFWTPGAWTARYLDALESACAEHDVTVLWVDGNHEDHETLLQLPIDPATGLRPIRDHIAHLPRGLRWTWHGKTWMALGGAHSVDRHERVEGRSWWPQEHLSPADIEAAISGGPVDVMVCHDCPDGVAIPGLNPARFPAEQIATGEWHRRQVGNVVRALEPELLMHGHYHVRYSDRLGATSVIGLADDSTSLRDNLMVLDLAG